MGQISQQLEKRLAIGYQSGLGADQPATRKEAGYRLQEWIWGRLASDWKKRPTIRGKSVSN